LLLLIPKIDPEKGTSFAQNWWKSPKMFINEFPPDPTFVWDWLTMIHVCEKALAVWSSGIVSTHIQNLGS
jgi:hypothetical protein